MFTLPLGFFGSAGTAHVSEWNTENLGGTGSATKELVLPFPAGPLVDWQDGTVNNLNAHTYAAGGPKTLIIEGDISGWAFNNLGDKEKLTKIVHVGGLAIDTAGAFYGASNMEWTAGFAPKVITTLNSAFRGATVFNGNINNWNVENVTDAEHAFREAEEYNQPMNTWNTVNFTSLFFTFQFALKFNQDVNSWNVGNVTNMIATFSGAIDYDQPLNLWNTGSVTLMSAMFDTSLSFNQEIEVWNVAAVTDMSDMFLDALLFNKNISAWSTGAVLDMSSMFENALAFNKDIDAWNVAAVTNMSRMFAGMLAFKQDLNSWDTGNVTNMAAMFSLNDAFDHVPDWDVSSCLDFSFMFSEANNIVYDGIVTWTLKPAASINMQSCFRANNAMTTPMLLVNSGSITNHNSMYSFTMITTFPPYDYTNTTNLGGYCQQADVTIVTACNAPLCTNMFDFVSSCPVTSVSGIVTTSALTTTGFMFSGCTVLASVAVFITSGVTNAQSMFQNTFALPDIPVFDWSSNINFAGFLSGTSITTASYDDLLVSIDANGLSTGTLDGGSSTFTPAPAAGGVAKDAMLGRSWTITDDGPVASTVELYYRIHDYGVAQVPDVALTNPAAISVVSTSSSQAQTALLFHVTKAQIDGKRIYIDWNSTFRASASIIRKMSLYDGHLQGDDPSFVGESPLPTGTSIAQHSGSDSGQIQESVLVPDLSLFTSFITIMVLFSDLWSADALTGTLTDLEIRETNETLISSLPLTGTISETGIDGQSSFGEFG